MKSFFKRSAISLIVIGMAGSASAMANNTATSWFPHFSGAFIGVEGLDLRPQNGDLDYVTFFPTSSLISPPTSFYTKALSTDYSWDWRVYGGVKFTDNDDITLSWMKMRNSEKDSVSIDQTGPGNIFTQPRWLSASPWDSVYSRVKFDLDDIYGVWGHTVRFNNPWSVRFAAGVEYAKLDSDLTTTASAVITPAESILQPAFSLLGVGYTAKSNMKGMGPRAEFDMAYGLPYGLALFANTNVALLAAERDVSLDPTVSTVLLGDDPETDPTATYYQSTFSKRHVVVPKFGMRLGVSYTYFFGQAGGEGASCTGTSLSVNAGWQVESYIHAIERPTEGFADITSGPSIVAQTSTGGFASTKTSNFGSQGLFVGISVGSDWM